MYLPGSRVSSVVHLAYLHPLAACIAAAGFAVVAFAYLSPEDQARFVPLPVIKAYCKDPAHPPLPLPAATWKQLAETCVCFDNICGS